jgi:EmrB/QacA subfamily drug resistance transporter
MSCLALFMVVLDATIVTVALPDMKAGLGLSTGRQQWVVSGYLITLGGLLLLAARAGDLYGHKRVFLAGAAVFTGASLLGGLASTGGLLIAARVVQGAGAAALTPASLSLVTASHTEPRERERALALWSMTGGLAGLFGVVLGGVLTAELSWRWVLFVNVPPGLALLAAGAAYLLPAAGTAGTRLDLPGALCVTLGVGALSYGLSRAAGDGWGSPGVVAPLAAAAVLLAGFLLAESRSRHPLVPAALVRLRTLRLANALMLPVGVALTSVMFFLSLYLQQVVGYSALRTGMAILPITVVYVLGGLVSRRLTPVAGPRAMLVAGGLLAAGGIAWLGTVPAHAAYASHVLAPNLVGGFGLSVMLLAVTLTGTDGVAPQDAGAASGLLNTSRQLGGAVGLAVLVTVASTVTSHAGGTQADALVAGYRAAFLATAGLMLLSALLALALPPRRRRGSSPEDAPGAAEGEAAVQVGGVGVRGGQGRD